MEGQVAEGLEVSRDLLQALVLSLHRHEDVHLKDVLCAGEFLVGDVFLQAVELIEGDVHQVGGVGAGSFDGQAKHAGIREVRVNRGRAVDEVVVLHEVRNSTAVHALAGATRAECGSAAQHGVGDMERGNVGVRPGYRFKSKRDLSIRCLSPSAGLTANVLGLLTGVEVLRDRQELAEALLNEVDIFSVVSDSGGNNEALLRRDVVHDELLEDAGIEVVDVAVQTEAGHAQSLDTVGILE